jgi:hypothetical protein
MKYLVRMCLTWLATTDDDKSHFVKTTTPVFQYQYLNFQWCLWTQLSPSTSSLNYTLNLSGLLVLGLGVAAATMFWAHVTTLSDNKIKVHFLFKNRNQTDDEHKNTLNNYNERTTTTVSQLSYTSNDEFRLIRNEIRFRVFLNSLFVPK